MIPPFERCAILEHLLPCRETGVEDGYDARAALDSF